MFHFLRRRGQTGDRAAGTEDIDPIPQRPTIGLALGGGAARGFAHIGVLRTLIARGLTPDIVTGTSIGAVVGACYAANRLDAIDEWARSLTRRRMLGYLDLSFGGSGLMSGGRLFERLAASLGDTMIDELAVRFAAIATEIGTGHEIWITRGRLSEAVRASYALPGIFAPVSIGGRWLMDGALVNPVPVSAARALGARVVIAVNVNTELFGRGTTIHDHGSDVDDHSAAQASIVGSDQDAQITARKAARRQFLGTPGRPGISTVMVDAFNVMQDRITRARLAGDPPDVLVSPRAGRIGLFDFHRADEAIALGAEAAEKALEPLGEALAALA